MVVVINGLPMNYQHMENYMMRDFKRMFSKCDNCKIQPHCDMETELQIRVKEVRPTVIVGSLFC
jgi:hypothetical protein